MHEHTSTLTLAHTGTYTYSRRGTCIHLFYQVISYYLIILFVNSTKIFPGLMQKYLSCVIDNLTTLFLKIESLDVLLLLLANLLFVKDNISILYFSKRKIILWASILSLCFYLRSNSINHNSCCLLNVHHVPVVRLSTVNNFNI